MSERGQPDLTRLLRDLTRELQTLQREIENRDRRERSTRRQLSRFTSEVAIPGVILLLETNIRALKLLRRAIRLAEGREPQEGGSGTAATEMRERAERLGTATLSRLDERLAEVQSSLAADEQEQEDELQAMVAEARDLQREIRERIEKSGAAEGLSTGVEGHAPGSEREEAVAEDHISIDVESELRTLKDDLEDDEPGHSDGEERPGQSGGDDGRDRSDGDGRTDEGGSGDESAGDPDASDP